MLAVALGNKGLGAGCILRGFNAGKRSRGFAGTNGRNLGNAGVIGRDGAVGQSGERGELFGKRCRAGFKMEPLELELRRGELRLQEIGEGIDTGLRALLLDGDKARSKLVLLAGGGEFGIDCIQLDVGRGGIESNLLACVHERCMSSLHAGARGVDVLDLRQAEDHRLHRAVPDGRQGAGETNLRKCGQA